jgi:hypothetical protein
MRLLRFEDDGGVERKLSLARVIVMQAALDSLDGETSPAATMAREKYAAARKVAEDQNEPQAGTKYDELRLRAIAAQRAALQRLRSRGVRSAKKPFTAFRRSSTGPSSMPRRPEAFNRW